jgi:pSer/pThr/pTyr-binding forkhead associated (FHA) protein
VLIGMSERCSVRLTSDMASPEHAAIVFDGDSWFLRDLGSLHGTYLNGEKISSATIADGDLLGFGPEGAEIQVLEVDPPPARADAVPVLDPVDHMPPPRPAPAPVRRVASWPGLLVLLLFLGGLAWLSSRPDDGIRPVARAASPRELHRLAASAIRQGRLEILYDLLDPAGREALASRIAERQDGESVREACARLGREGELEIEGPGPGTYVRADLEADGASGFMVLEAPDGQTRRRRIVLVDGSWRLASRER